ncbi:MAG: transposase zinc-binding domain-containing protein [Hyphomonadaceae bacterium]|nr:transposase zinc-binding domain-containing protein [Hyphomonadaceae bacterium]
MPTAALGGHVKHCADCGLVRVAYNSCRNRHRPKCQSMARSEWLASGKPSCCRYRTSMSCSPSRPRWPRSPSRTRRQSMRCRVLHTWGHNRHHHPHVHCVVLGGGLSLDGTRWVACRPDYTTTSPR